MDRGVELRLALGLAAFGAFWLYGTTLINRTLPQDRIGEAGLPTFLGLLFVGGGLILAYRNIRARRSGVVTTVTMEAEDEPGYPVSGVRPISMWVLSVAWTVALVPLGFVLATTLFLGASLWLLQFRRWDALAVISISISVALAVTFDVFLQVSLPAGPLPF